MSRRIFYSFHFDNDVFRVQQIRQIGAFEGDKPVTVNEWETVKSGGDTAIKKWIDDNIYGKSCVVVLIGQSTTSSKWVNYEIQKAIDEGKALLGIYIHNLNCPRNGTCSKGSNPFIGFKLLNGKNATDIIPCYDPSSNDAYGTIKSNISSWVEDAIAKKTW